MVYHDENPLEATVIDNRIVYSSKTITTSYASAAYKVELSLVQFPNSATVCTLTVPVPSHYKEGGQS